MSDQEQCSKPVDERREAYLPTSSKPAVAAAYKLIEAAQARWRVVNAPHLVALVRAGGRFEGGKLVERPQPATPQGRAA